MWDPTAKELKHCNSHVQQLNQLMWSDRQIHSSLAPGGESMKKYTHEIEDEVKEWTRHIAIGTHLYHETESSMHTLHQPRMGDAEYLKNKSNTMVNFIVDVKAEELS